MQLADRIALGPLAGRVTTAVSETLNLLLPTSCAVCERPDSRLCPECRRALAGLLHLPPVPGPLQARIELPGSRGQFLACAAGRYNNELARAILAFKNRQRLFLRAEFGTHMAALANALCPPQPPGRTVWLVPVPSSARAMARRGYWPVRELLADARRAGRLRPELECHCILRYRLSATLRGSQKGRAAAQRRQAASAFYAFTARRPAQQVLLLDDVLTTGSTLAAAAAACTEAGYQVIGAVVLALTAPPSHDPAP